MEKQNHSRITELASIISENTSIFERYLQNHNIPTPSFDKQSAPLLKLPEDVQRVQETILESNMELQALIGGPIMNIRNQTMPHCNLIALEAIHHFGIATSFPIEEEVSYQQISERCGLNEVDLRRIVRYAMTKYIFYETSEGKVAHTASSRILAEMPIFNDFVGMVRKEMWPAASRTVYAMVKWPGSQEPTHTGFAVANNIEDTLFSELSKYPARAKRFSNAMGLINNEIGFEPYHVLDAFAWWDSVQLLVDIGGARGEVSFALVERLPKLQCIIQDLPAVVAEVSSSKLQNPSNRVTFMAHDFFTEQPVTGADVYFLRWVFHNYSDKYAIKILRSLIPALKPGARIVISEFVIPQPGMVSKYKEWLIRTMDLAMLELLNAKERDIDDWKMLFKSAHDNFRFIGVRRPKDSKLCFIEISWAGVDFE